jgi:hypothetical protein
MQRTFRWLGGLFCAFGVALIVANLVMGYMGLAATFNFGDAEKFQFVLVPFWQIGLAIVAVGGACLSASWYLK